MQIDTALVSSVARHISLTSYAVYWIWNILHGFIRQYKPLQTLQF